MTKRLVIVAGEVSGDQHAAQLVRDVRRVRPDVDWVGIGGDDLRREGVRTLVDARDMAVLGFSEVVCRLPFFWSVFRRMSTLLASEKPDALLLVDYPGFNLRLAKVAKGLGIPVLYYISPQVWAWHRSRIPRMARILDLLMVIFPFEVEVFKGTGLQTVFVGHPLVASVRRTLQQPSPVLPWPPGRRRVVLLPGSRQQEIRRILPVMLEAARILLRRDPSTAFLVAAANPDLKERIEARIATLPVGERKAFVVLDGQLREGVRQAHAAMVCSGTATMEVALLGCPMIVVYRTTALTYWFGRRVIQVPWLGMVNIISNETLCPEFIQHQARPVSMADAVETLLADGPERHRQQTGLERVGAALQGDDTVKSAGQWVAEVLG